MRTNRYVPLLLLAACAAEAGPDRVAQADGCEILQPSSPLSPELTETSGVAASRRQDELLWTHNDSGAEPVIYPIDPSGRIVGRVRVAGAENEDWEDIAAGPCPAGDCLFIADMGDNQERREDIAFYRIPEPKTGAGETAEAERFPFRYPGGPRDAEALFVLPSGELFVVSKGRGDREISLFRYPLPFRAEETVELEKVAELGTIGGDLGRQITGAAASPGGKWVAVRRYDSFAVYPAERFTRGEVAPVLETDLRPLGEPQGEAIEILDNGRVVLTSESRDGAPALVSVLNCTLPGS